MRNHQLNGDTGVPQRVLVLAPHTDDAEFGCGGTIAKLIEEGAKVHVRAFSICRNIDLQEDFRQACELMGVEGSICEYDARRFPEHRQSILDDLIMVRNRFEPTVVFLPNLDDIHQDHQVIAQEAVRAFKHCTLLGYELPWNSLRMETTAYMHLEERHVAMKVAAVQVYRSQRSRNYAHPEAVRAVCRMRGTAIGTVWAEAFQSIRHIL